MIAPHIKQVVFLVGGKGTRLGDLTQDMPKPMLEVEPSVRFLDVLIENAARRGFTDIILLAGYLGEKMHAAYHGAKVRGAMIEVVIEPEPQGTGGALRFIADRLDPWFLLCNGDSFFDINLRDLASSPPVDALARIALREVPDPARYGSVELDGARICAFREKNAELVGPALINGGIYVLSRHILSLITGPCSLESDIFPQLVRSSSIEGRAYDGYFIDMGLPDSYLQSQREVPGRRRRSCVFLDRDGVINHDDGYTYRPQDLRFIDGAPEAIRALNEAGYYVIVVTNQAGVAKGRYSEADVLVFHDVMNRRLAEQGAHVDGFYYCPFHENAMVKQYHADNHEDRKPNPGMLLKAMEAWPIIRDGSFLIGDKDSDIAAAHAAGIPGYLFTAGNLADFVASIMAAQAPTK